METTKKIYQKAWQFFSGYVTDIPDTAEKWHDLLMEAETNFYTPYIGTEYEFFSVKLISLIILRLEELSKKTKGANTNEYGIRSDGIAAEKTVNRPGE